MGISISIILIIFGFFYRNSKILFNIQFIWIYLLSAFNSGGPDYNGYEEIFKLGSNKWFSYGPGSIYLNGAYIFNNLGLNFYFYNFILTTLIYLFIYKYIYKYSYKKNRSSIVTTYLLIFPTLDNIIQKRNFIMSVILIYSILLFNNNSIKNKIKYFMSIIIMIGLHVSSIIYIIYFLAFYSLKKIKKLIKYIIILIIPLLILISKLYEENSKVKLYLLDKNNRLGIIKVLIFIITHLIFFSIVIYVEYRSKRKKKIKVENKKIEKFNELILKLNYISLVFIAFYYWNSTFFRYYRNIIILNYIYVENYIYIYGRDKIDKYFQLIIYIWLLFYFIIFYCLSGDLGFTKLVIPIFKNNKLFEIINKYF